LGQQQILLIVLALIIVGIAVAMGILIFRQNAIESKRDIVMNECTNLADMAMTYSKKPRAFGGGGNAFTGWDVPNNLKITESGTYVAAVQPDKVVITGTGNEVVNGKDSVQVQTIVTVDSIKSIIIH
jgi:hypothetical protein